MCVNLIQYSYKRVDWGDGEVMRFMPTRWLTCYSTTAHATLSHPTHLPTWKLAPCKLLRRQRQSFSARFHPLLRSKYGPSRSSSDFVAFPIAIVDLSRAFVQQQLQAVLSPLFLHLWAEGIWGSLNVEHDVNNRKARENAVPQLCSGCPVVTDVTQLHLNFVHESFGLSVAI